MRIRPAVNADLLAVGSLWAESWRAAYRRELPGWFLDSLDPGQRAEEIGAGLAGMRFELLVVESAGKPGLVGFCTHGRSRDRDIDAAHTREIVNFHTHPSHWRQGIGRAMIEAVLDSARRAGDRELLLWVMVSNRRARAFFERMSMRCDGLEREEALAPVVSITETRYRMTIDG